MCRGGRLIVGGFDRLSIVGCCKISATRQQKECLQNKVNYFLSMLTWLSIDFLFRFNFINDMLSYSNMLS